MTQISLENISKQYKTKEGFFTALDGITLAINKGDFVVLSGESGAGKSTLLSIMETLKVPTSGKYLLDGTDVLNLSSSKRATLRNEKIGILLQDFPLIDKFNVYDNVRIPFYFSAVAIKDQATKINIILDRLGISHLKKKSVRKISGGEKQRVAIARALVMDPDIIIADEPTSNLDAGNRDLFMDLMNELNMKEKTIIISSHDKEIISNARRHISLKKGKMELCEKD